MNDRLFSGQFPTGFRSCALVKSSVCAGFQPVKPADGLRSTKTKTKHTFHHVLSFSLYFFYILFSGEKQRREFVLSDSSH